MLIDPTSRKHTDPRASSLLYDWDWSAAERAFVLAVRLKPAATREISRGFHSKGQARISSKARPDGRVLWHPVFECEARRALPAHLGQKRR